MRHFLGLTVASIAAMLATGGVAGAQVITITTPNFKSADLVTIEPKGTFIYPVAGDYTVKFDVGYFNKDAKFVPDPNVAKETQASPVLLLVLQP